MEGLRAHRRISAVKMPLEQPACPVCLWRRDFVGEERYPRMPGLPAVQAPSAASGIIISTERVALTINSQRSKETRVVISTISVL